MLSIANPERQTLLVLEAGCTVGTQKCSCVNPAVAEPRVHLHPFPFVRNPRAQK